MKVQDALKKMTWLKDQRTIGRFRCEKPSENQDLSTLINQVILALGKPEPLAKNTSSRGRNLKLLSLAIWQLLYKYLKCNPQHKVYHHSNFSQIACFLLTVKM